MTPPADIGRFRRLRGWDYAKGASFFITLALEERRPLFGEVRGGEVLLSPLGREVLASLERIPRLEPAISLFGHVVMPDHVHFNCHLAAGLREPLQVLGRAIRSFKNHTTKVYKLALAEPGSAFSTPFLTPALPFPAPALPGPALEMAEPPVEMAGPAVEMAEPPVEMASPAVEMAEPAVEMAEPAVEMAEPAVEMAEPRSAREGFGGRGGPRPPRLWRLGYHDYLCLSRAFLDSTERYIAYNPLKWWLMHGAGALRVQEPLLSPRLDPADYWKGVGNLALLSHTERLLALRVSRQVRDPAPVVARMERAADQGFVVVSGFVSPGEQAVRDALCRRPGAKLIRLRATGIPNARFKPESAYVEAFAEGRCLELGRGNEEAAFGRAACLDLNREIVSIATSGPGLALYFTKEGLRRLA